MKYKTYRGGLRAFQERFSKLCLTKHEVSAEDAVEVARLRKAIRELLRFAFKPTLNKPWSKNKI